MIYYNNNNIAVIYSQRKNFIIIHLLGKKY